MNESQKTFRDELLDMEKANIPYKEKYEKEIKEMFEKKLTGADKWLQILGLGMGLGFFALFGTLAIIVPKEFPLWGRFIWILGAVFGLVSAALSVWILKKGTVNLKTDDMAAAGLGWAFIVIVATLVLVFSGKLPDKTLGIHMLVSVLVFEVMAAAGLLKAIIQRSEVNTREKLLEIEYRLAELAEKLKAAETND
jgi:hypothetical protein